MSKLKDSFVLKAIAITLLCVSVTSLLCSGFCYATGMSYGAFWESPQKLSEAKDDLLENLLLNAGNWVEARVYISSPVSEKEERNWKFPDVSGNLMYDVKDENGELLFSNVDGSAVSMTSAIKSIKTYYYINPFYKELPDEEPYIDEGIDEVTTASSNHNTIYPAEKEEPEYIRVEIPIELTVYLKSEMAEKDGFYTADKAFDFLHINEKIFSTVFIISAVLSLFLLIFIMCAAGHKTNIEGLHISRFDKCPYELLLLLLGGACAGLVYICVYLFDEVAWDAFYNWEIGAFPIIELCVAATVASALICVFLLTMLTYTAAVRFKTKTFIKTTLVYHILRYCWIILKFCGRGVKRFFGFISHTLRKLPLVWKTVLITAVIAIMLFVCLALACDGEPVFAVFGMLFTIACCILLILVSIMLKTIKKGTEDIVDGKVQQKIDTKYMIGDVRRHAENINRINDGIANAVEQKMKSERFKTELITNVSHDIKTPLTSIINYVDLLEKEDIDNETAEQYIEVLSRQSARLKKLIEDLLEASKASTGNLPVNLSKLEIGIMLSQALGEYGGKFEKAGLEVVLAKPDEQIFVNADSRHIWRIFDNVFNNIAKYAQPNTRVYMEISRRGNSVETVFKNISREQLNISGEELMERFVRGDSSRNTEGSGLGLSIAKNLAELQNGAFDIQIDGDLFKVKLLLPLYDER